jgi:hypothetical protein
VPEFKPNFWAGASLLWKPLEFMRFSRGGRFTPKNCFSRGDLYTQRLVGATRQAEELLMKTCVVVISCALLGALQLVSSGRAQAIATLDENSTLVHVLANDQPGAVTVTPNSVVFDVVPGPIPELGLIGVTVSVPPMEVDFMPSDYRWLMRLRVLEGNDVAYVAAHALDRDINDPGLSEIWEYRFDISTLTPADGWVTLRQDFSAPVLTLGPADGIFNPDLEAIAFVVNDQLKTRLHVELDYLQIVPVPEPGGMALWLLGLWASAAVRIRGGA